ncbi:MAG: ATP-binding cassette domain-containing protein [Chloroflexota bacterium]
MTTSPPAGAVAVEARGFGWTYRGRERPALAGIDFVLDPGAVLLVVGPSGSGKSTLALALAGLIPHAIPGTWVGRLVVDGLDVSVTPAPVIGERVGVVFQDPETGIVLDRVADEIAFGLENRAWPLERMRARVPEALGLAGLAGFEARRTANLSGGEQQRLAIAGALAPEPGLLVLDEPTANLDPPGMAAVFERLGALAERRDRTIVVVEHRLDAVLPIADLVLAIGADGLQLAFGPPDEVGASVAATLDRLGAWVPAAWRRHLARPVAVGGPPEPAGIAAPRAGQTWTVAPRAGPAEVVARGAGPAVVEAPGPAGVGPVVARAAGVTVPDRTVTAGPGRDLLHGVSLQVRAGERVALVGPNGAGKSSLLFVLAGILRPSEGSVGVRDPGTAAAAPRDVASSPGAAAPRALLRPPAADAPFADPALLPASRVPSALGLVFQDPEVGFVGRTVAMEVAAGARASSDALLEQFGLDGLAAEDPYRLSRGEQRRLSVAAACASAPALLLLDEPTYGLDRRATDAVVAMLDELRAAGQAQVVATHDPRLLPWCDRVVALDIGRIVFDGSVAAFLASPPYDPPDPWRAAAAGAGRPSGAP